MKDDEVYIIEPEFAFKLAQSVKSYNGIPGKLDLLPFFTRVDSQYPFTLQILPVVKNSSSKQEITFTELSLSLLQQLLFPVKFLTQTVQAINLEKITFNDDNFRDGVVIFEPQIFVILYKPLERDTPKKTLADFLGEVNIFEKKLITRKNLLKQQVEILEKLDSVQEVSSKNILEFENQKNKLLNDRLNELFNSLDRVTGSALLLFSMITGSQLFAEYIQVAIKK